MSDPVRVSANNHRNTLNNLHKHNKNEVSKTRQQQELTLEELKKSHEHGMVELREQNARDIDAAAIKKEETLQQMRGTLDKSKQLTDAELKRQQVHLQARRTSVEQHFAENMDRVQNQHQESMDDQNYRFTTDLKERDVKQGQQTRTMVELNRAEHAKESDLWKNKIQSQRDQFSARYNTEGVKYQHHLNQQEMKGKKQVMTEHQKHETRLATMTDQHVKQEKELTEKQQAGLVTKEQMFEKKYSTQMQQHLSSEQHLESLHKDIVKKSEDSLLSRVSAAKERSNDPFFKFTELKPIVKEEPQQYVIKVQVPEYAKEEVLLSANPKELVLTHNRRFKDERHEEGGITKKVDKVESLVNRIPVNQVLDSRKITKTWDDGTLTFTVKKA